MIRKTPVCIATLLILVLALAPCGADMCQIRIGDPRNGQTVGLTFNVKGNMKLPADHHLWVFARPVNNFRTLQLWWPQGEATVDSATGDWELPATFGSPQKNIGDKFDLTAAVFAPEQHYQLVAYLQQAMEANNYKPISMPAAVCSATSATVRKTKD